MVNNRSSKRLFTSVIAPLQSVPFPWDYLLSVFIISVITAIGVLIRHLVVPTNLVMLYLLGVVLVATLYGRGPSIFSSVLAVLAFDFFLIPPYLTFVVENTEYVIVFLALFLVGVFISSLTSQITKQMLAALDREARITQLQKLSQKLAAAYTKEDMIKILMGNIHKYFTKKVWLILKDADSGTEKNPSGIEIYSTPNADNQISATQALSLLKEGERSDHHSTKRDHPPASHVFPLETSQGIIGVFYIPFPDPKEVWERDQVKLFQAHVNLTSLALERIRLQEQTHQTKLLQEKEKFQSVLLNTISHEFRTPLATITGTLSSLGSEIYYLDEEAQKQLAHNALQEAERLNRLVENLLSMSRLESGVLRPQTEPVDVQDLIGATLRKNNQEDHPISTHIPDQLPLISADFVLVEQVLTNIVDNAIKYSPHQAPVKISADWDGQHLHIDIADRGPGIPKADLPHIFDKFYRVENGSQPSSGTGLGLAIAKGIMDLHQGKISARSREGGGMVFRTTFLISDKDR